MAKIGAVMMHGSYLQGMETYFVDEEDGGRHSGTDPTYKEWKLYAEW